MSVGSTAYASFVRIHVESGEPTFPSWEGLSHVGRMAWEAAAQAVALSVLPTCLSMDLDDGVESDDGENDLLEDVTLNIADEVTTVST